MVKKQDQILWVTAEFLRFQTLKNYSFGNKGSVSVSCEVSLIVCDTSLCAEAVLCKRDCCLRRCARL